MEGSRQRGYELMLRMMVMMVNGGWGGCGCGGCGGADAETTVNKSIEENRR